MSWCKKCPARVIWVKTVNGKAMQIDAEPVDGGNIELRNGVAHVVPPNPAVRRYVSHFATCPAAASFRKPKLERLREQGKDSPR